MSTQARLEWEDFRRIAPEANAALLALGKATAESGLGKDLLELVKLRASQINGCAFCTQLHLNVARQAGVAAEKLDLLAVWREAGVFSPREQAALAWTETLTDIARQGAPDEAYAALRQSFDENEAVFLTVAVATINTWNRIAGPLRFSPPIPRAAGAERAA
jgi:AhpD family alkylhydroperoxidase